MQGSDVVLNCVGPFYRSVKTVVNAVLELGINYVDVCDDVDVTIELLDMDALHGEGGEGPHRHGSSPGATNLLAKFASTSLLDKTDSIDIFTPTAARPSRGRGHRHRFHCMSIDIPMFLDGRLHVKFFEEDGIALRQTFDFPAVGQ